MEIAYLILTHNTPSHTKRLIRSLSSDSSTFFIHLDKKTPQKDYEQLENEVNLYFTQKRISVYWADFSQVEAILALIEEAFNSPKKFDRYVLLSGADYPIRSVEEIEGFFNENRDKEFINTLKMPCNAGGKPIERITEYTPRRINGKIIYNVQRVLRKIGIIKRTRDYKEVFKELQPHGGDTWWALTHDAIECILRFVKLRPQVYEYYKNTVCPDEGFFQTILANSELSSAITTNLTYADWSKGGDNPALITDSHLSKFKSEYFSDDYLGDRRLLFARKFSEDSDGIISKLDIQRQYHAPPLKGPRSSPAQ